MNTPIVAKYYKHDDTEEEVVVISFKYNPYGVLMAVFVQADGTIDHDAAKGYFKFNYKQLMDALG